MASSRSLTCGLVVLLVLAAALPAGAGEVLFSIRDGRVTLVARNAPISDILAVWEKEGRTKIVARERVQGVVTSLEFANEPEAAALATVLRNVTSYIAAKHAVAPADASIYRCIVINPAPAPAYVAQAAPAPTGRGATNPYPGMGYPQSSMGGDSGSIPQMYLPPPYDSDGSGGSGRVPVPQGMRPPGIGLSGGDYGQPPSDPYGTGSAQAQRPGPPTVTPTFPGVSTTQPGIAVPPPQVPGAVAPPVRKPPGSPDRQ
jgi:hypothetical protein